MKHLRPSRRPQPPLRGDHQPSAVPDRDRDPYAPRAANDDPRDQLTRHGQARPSSACRRRRVPARPGQKCGAVHPPGNLAGDPVARLPGLPQRPPPARPAPSRAQLMQPKREKPQTHQTSHRPTAGFRLTGSSRSELSHPRDRRLGSSRRPALRPRFFSSGSQSPLDNPFPIRARP